MTTVPKEPYWERLVAHYFDHVWGEKKLRPADLAHADLMRWLSEDMNIDTDNIRFGDTIRFRDEQSATAFLLRWS